MGKGAHAFIFDKGCGLVQLTGGGHSLPARKRAGARFDSQLAKVLYSSAGSAHCTLGTKGVMINLML